MLSEGNFFKVSKASPQIMELVNCFKSKFYFHLACNGSTGFVFWISFIELIFFVRVSFVEFLLLCAFFAQVLLLFCSSPAQYLRRWDRI